MEGGIILIELKEISKNCNVFIPVILSSISSFFIFIFSYFVYSIFLSLILIAHK